MMRARLTYVPLEVADHFGDFIIKRDEQVLDAVRARTRDFSTLSLLKLLYQVRSEPMTFVLSPTIKKGLFSSRRILRGSNPLK